MVLNIGCCTFVVWNIELAILHFGQIVLLKGVGIKGVNLLIVTNVLSTLKGVGIGSCLGFGIGIGLEQFRFVLNNIVFTFEA